MTDAEKTSDLLTRLQAVDRMKLPDRIHDTANALGAAFTDECIEPYELAEVATFAELPTDRQAHVRSCSLCALVVGAETNASGVAPSREYVAAAAVAARQPTRLRQWIFRPATIAVGLGTALLALLAGILKFGRRPATDPPPTTIPAD
jgi:hypothetical protein